MLRNAMLDLPRETGGSLGTEGAKLQAACPRTAPIGSKYNELSAVQTNHAGFHHRKGRYFNRLRMSSWLGGTTNSCKLINEFMQTDQRIGAWRNNELTFGIWLAKHSRKARAERSPWSVVWRPKSALGVLDHGLTFIVRSRPCSFGSVGGDR